MRTHVAADLHDDIGASLSQLAVLSEVLYRRLGETDPQVTATLTAMRRIASEAVDAMSDIVWTTNPQHDSLANLVRRMRRFASEILPGAGLEFTFHAPRGEPDWRLAADVRRQVFLIFKESLNNIVRHANCTQAEIVLTRHRRGLHLQLRDNGCGFVVGQAAEGNGLKNLHRRAQMLGAQLRLDSTARGTVVSLFVPYQQTVGKLARQALHVWIQHMQINNRISTQAARTYLNRGVTWWATRPTLRPSAMPKITK
ncbi:MAG: histidine kinase [Blastocatellia bacterium]